MTDGEGQDKIKASNKRLIRMLLDHPGWGINLDRVRQRIREYEAEQKKQKA